MISQHIPLIRGGISEPHSCTYRLRDSACLGFLLVVSENRDKGVLQTSRRLPLIYYFALDATESQVTTQEGGDT